MKASWGTVVAYVLEGSCPTPLKTRRAEFHGLCPWVNEKAAI